jgi:hypothetical protein
MDKFSIILPNEKKGTYKILTILISVINIVGFSYFSMQVAEDSSSHTLSSVGVAMCAGPLGLYLFYKKDRPNNLSQIIFSFFLASIFWMLIGFYLMGLLLLSFALTGLLALRNLKVDIDTNFIYYPSFPRKKIEWNEVSNLIFKDNILTIDLKNNKLIQHTIDENENEDLDETTFNTFVQQKLNNIPQS